MGNFILAAVLLMIVGLAAGYIIRAKKSGVKCVGCPHARECAARRNGQACGTADENK